MIIIIIIIIIINLFSVDLTITFTKQCKGNSRQRKLLHVKYFEETTLRIYGFQSQRSKMYYHLPIMARNISEFFLKFAVFLFVLWTFSNFLKFFLILPTAKTMFRYAPTAFLILFLKGTLMQIWKSTYMFVFV